MDKNVSLLLSHLAHPLIVICKVLLDVLFGEILYQIDFVVVVWIFGKGCAEI